MPAHRDSLRITDTYRKRLVALRDHAAGVARDAWAQLDPEALDATHAEWVAATATTTEAIQHAGLQLTAGYLAAFLTSEMRRPTTPPPINPARYAGRARDGRPLTDTLAATLIAVKTALTDGTPVTDALAAGATRATRLVSSEAIAAPRAALADEIHADPRISGWRRVTAGGCGACLAAASETHGDDEPLPVHDGCRCTAEPVVAGTPDHFPRPTGRQLLDHMTVDEQDALLGAEKAQLLRSGAIDLSDLISRSPMVAIDDQITETPLKDLTGQ
jgi:hypothetical protein